MNILKYCLLTFFPFFLQSCAKELFDDDDFILSNNGKNLEIYISSLENLREKTEGVVLYDIEQLKISGKISGHDLALLRDLSGGDDVDFLGGRNLNTLNLKDADFLTSEEVYYDRNNKKLKITKSGDIPAYAFEYCYTLGKIVFPDCNIAGYYNIEHGAFKDCLLLRYIDWGTRIRKIKKEAFLNCSTLALGQVLILPEGLLEIDDEAFKKTVPKDLDLPSTLLSIGKEAFSPILGDVVIRAKTPPVVYDSSFIFDKKSSRRLYVPGDVIEQYKIEPYLSIFSEILPLE